MSLWETKYLQNLLLPAVLQVEEKPLPQPVMGEMAPAVPDANHRLDHEDALRHPGGLAQPGLAEVESHCLNCRDHSAVG